jgi:hypothetical protein
MGYIGPDDLFPGLHEAVLGQGEARRLLLRPPEQKEGCAKAKPSKYGGRWSRWMLLSVTMTVTMTVHGVDGRNAPVGKPGRLLGSRG